jgi:hypothetical protein
VVIAILLHILVLLFTQTVSVPFFILIANFGFCLSNLLIIPIWTFFQFSWFKDEWPFQSTIRSMFPLWYDVWAQKILAWHEARAAAGKFVITASHKTIVELIYSILSIFLVVFVALGMLVGNPIGSTGLDAFAFVFAVLVPLARYILLFIGYSLNSILSFSATFRDRYLRLEFAASDPFNYTIYAHRRPFAIGANGHSPLAYFSSADDNTAIPACIRVGGRAWEVYRWLVAIASLLTIIILPAVAEEAHGGRAVGFALFFLVFIFPLLITLQFPFIGFTCAGGKCEACGSLEGAGTVPSQRFARFVLTRWTTHPLRICSLVVSAVVLFICIVLPAVLVFARNESRDLPLPADFAHSAVPVDPPAGLVVSDLCAVKAFRLGMLQVAALAGASRGNISPPSATVIEYISEFFPATNPDFEVSDFGEMEADDYAYGAAAFFEFERLNLTVFSVRGRVTAIDTALGAQFLMSSGLLALSMPLSVFLSSTTPFTMSAIQAALSLPVHLMREITLIDRYVAHITQYYESIPKLPHVLFTGHSIGGGIAKLLGRMYGKHSIAVSGPGIAVYESVYPQKEGKVRDMSTAITDVVPDLDLVAKLEVSPGVTYRVLCDEGASTCHSIWHTVCMMGIMCGTEHKDLCTKIPEIEPLYDNMVKFAKE